MKKQLTNYIDLLFAAAPEAGDIKQEILQNTLERYDDLIALGKTPQAAYQLAISGIGDISEILRTESQSSAPAMATTVHTEKPIWKKVLQAIAICLYILCPIPLFVLQNELGLCGLLVFVAVATALLIFSDSKNKAEKEAAVPEDTKESELHKSIRSIIWTVGLCAYFAISFTTNTWYITWVIFPLIGAVQGLVKACMDLKEADKNEK